MMLRWVIVGLLAMTGASFADDSSPWFGSEASQPLQIVFEQETSTAAPSANFTAELAKSDGKAECALEGCPTGIKIAKPLMEAAASP
jgi:hypothetical protein